MASTQYDYLINMKAEVDSAVSTINSNPCSAISSEVSNIITDLGNAKMSGTDSISSSVNSALTQCISTFTAINSSINSTFRSIETQYKSFQTALTELEAAKKHLEEVEASKPIAPSGGS